MCYRRLGADADDVIALYEKHADGWDAHRTRALFEHDWLERFRELLPERASILDLGCGSGEPIARYFVDNGHHVCGVDTSSTMIARCEARFPDHEWHLADMRGLSLDRKFHGILAWDSFFHLTRGDQREMFEVFARHAAAGAALMFTSGPEEGEVVGELEGEPLYHASLGPAEYRRLLGRHGFSVISYVEEDPDCGAHTIWLSRRDSAPWTR